MPPGAVSFTIHSGLPPVSYWTRCHLSISSNQPFWARHSQKSSERCASPQEGDRNSAPSGWVIKLLLTGSCGIEMKKSGPLLDLSLVMWLPQPIRTSPSGSVWGLLGQSRCEQREGGGKGVSTEFQSHIFTLLSVHTYIIPLAQRLWLSLPPLYHVLSAHFVFSPFFFKHYSSLLIKSIAASPSCSAFPPLAFAPL